MVDVLITIGVVVFFLFGFVLLYALCKVAEGDDETKEREKWSRTLDDFKTEPPDFLKKDDEIPEDFKEHIMERFTKRG